jgi:hypothetical protein
MAWFVWSRIGAGGAALGLAALIINGCGPAPAPTPPVAGTATALPTAPAATGAPATASAAPTSKPAPEAFDPCAGSKAPPKEYFGLLKAVPCEQQMFLTMASVAGQLDVECKHCHAPHPTDPKKEDYPVMTPKKDVANWMSMHLMSSIKPADGSRMTCKSCHVDDKGKPIAKILGNPRDPGKAQEWMSLVMVNKFVARNSGDKLKCKSCHAGNYTTPQWKAKVILKNEQIPAHDVGGGITR